MTTTETAVLDAEQQRCDAMLRGDTAALAELLDDRLMFVHSTGALDDKSQYLAKVASGLIAYVSIDWPERSVEALDARVAILSGRMVIDVSVEGVAKRLCNRVVSVWVCVLGAWKLAAFQSTPDGTGA